MRKMFFLSPGQTRTSDASMNFVSKVNEIASKVDGLVECMSQSGKTINDSSQRQLQKPATATTYTVTLKTV